MYRKRISAKRVKTYHSRQAIQTEVELAKQHINDSLYDSLRAELRASLWENMAKGLGFSR